MPCDVTSGIIVNQIPFYLKASFSKRNFLCARLYFIKCDMSWQLFLRRFLPRKKRPFSTSFGNPRIFVNLFQTLIFWNFTKIEVISSNFSPFFNAKMSLSKNHYRKKIHPLSERLASLGRMEAQLRAPFAPLDSIAP